MPLAGNVIIALPRSNTALQPAPRSATRDHKIPKARGGAYGKQNTALACLACNAVKKEMTEDEFRYFEETGDLADSYIRWITKQFRSQARLLCRAL
jgi:5-methylcytosine-specific restriction endonuclease McrA